MECLEKGLALPLSNASGPNVDIEVGYFVENIREQEYIDPAGVLKYVLDYILNCKRISRDFYSNFTVDEYYAPLFAICQRSGSGKTKTLIRIGQKHLPLIYVGCGGKVVSPIGVLDHLKGCYLRKDSADGNYEKQGPWAHEILKFFFACAEYAHSFFAAKLVPGTGDRYVMAEKNLTEFVHLFFKDFSNDMPDKQNPWIEIMNIISTKYSTGFELCIPKDAVENPFRKLRALFRYESWKLVFAFDEARALLECPASLNSANFYTPFESIRKVVRVYEDEMHELATSVVADTNSTIINFTPGTRDLAKSNSSVRSAPIPKILIPPFYQLSGFDTGAYEYLKAALTARTEWKNSCSSVTGPWNDFYKKRMLVSSGSLGEGFYSLGTPLWHTWKKSVDTFKVGNLTRYAAIKMNNGKSLQDELSSDAIIAALCCRVGLSVLPDSVLTRNLFACNMAQLTYLTLDGHYAHISYPSDPTLGEGAALIMEIANSRILRTLLEKVEGALIDIGMSGEVAVRLMILFALDKLRTLESTDSLPQVIPDVKRLKASSREPGSGTSKDPTSSSSENPATDLVDDDPEAGLEKPRELSDGNRGASSGLGQSETEEKAVKRQEKPHVPDLGTVEDFFRALLAPEYFEMARKKYRNTQIWNARLFINHTIILDRELTAENIIYALIRGGMITGFGVQPDWDVCLPVVLPNGQIGCIWIQVKNWAASIGPAKYEGFFKDMMCSNVLLSGHPSKGAVEHLYVVMNLRQGQLEKDGLSTSFDCNSTGGIFMQGSLDKLFQAPSNEEYVFELLAQLLRAQRASERQREKEMTLRAKALFKAQDHGRTACTLEHWRDIYKVASTKPVVPDPCQTSAGKD